MEKQNADQYLYQDGKWIKAGRTMAVVSSSSPSGNTSDDIIIKDIFLNKQPSYVFGNVENTNQNSDIVTVVTYSISDNVVDLIKKNPGKVVIRFNYKRKLSKSTNQTTNATRHRSRHQGNSFIFTDCIQKSGPNDAAGREALQGYLKNCLIPIYSSDIKKDKDGNNYIRKNIDMWSFYNGTMFKQISDVYELYDLSSEGSYFYVRSTNISADDKFNWRVYYNYAKTPVQYLLNTKLVYGQMIHSFIYSGTGTGENSRYADVFSEVYGRRHMKTIPMIISKFSYDISANYGNDSVGYNIFTLHVPYEFNPVNDKQNGYYFIKSYHTDYDSDAGWVTKTVEGNKMYSSKRMCRRRRFSYKLNFAILTDDWETSTKSSFEKVFDKYDNKIINARLFLDYYLESDKMNTKGHDLSFSVVTTLHHTK